MDVGSHLDDVIAHLGKAAEGVERVAGEIVVSGRGEYSIIEKNMMVVAVDIGVDIAFTQPAAGNAESVYLEYQ